METADAHSWEEKYGSDGPLAYGFSAEQGPRETMEDYVTVVPKGRCGFLYAGAALRQGWPVHFKSSTISCLSLAASVAVRLQADRCLCRCL